MRDFLYSFWEIAKIIIIAMLIVFPIRYFIFQPFIVKGASMEPTFSDGDYLIVDELSYRLRDPERGEVAIFKYPNDPTQRYIKRIVGLPGETIRILEGEINIFIEGAWLELKETEYLPEFLNTSGRQEVVLDEDEYFVLGDNRTASSDSRQWGVLPREFIIGRALFRALPLDEIDKFETPSYSF